MKTKLEMAHEIAVAMQSQEPITDMKLLSALAWQYADAMQAEADNREKEEAAQKRKEIREMLNAPNTFVEREGQHFDDVEWQPDWSQAPRCDVVSWDINEHGQARWIASDNGYYLAPSFCYTGDWRNSLRKRPQ